MIRGAVSVLLSGMSPAFYYVLHVAAAFVLFGITFRAFARPEPATRRGVMMISGIASLVLLVAGVGLLHKLGLGFPGWVIVKLVCWLALSALAGVAYRQPQKAGLLSWVAVVIVLVALVAVYMKPI